LRIKRMLIMITLGLIVILILVNILAWNHARCMMTYSGKELTPCIEQLTIVDKLSVLMGGISIPRPATLRTPADKNLPWKEVFIECVGNQRLSAWYIPRKGSRDLAVLYHGYCGEKSSMLDAAGLMYEMGWSVFLVDFRGSGDSSGSSTSIGYFEADDVICSMKYVKQEYNADRTLILGHSMGAAAVLRALSIGLTQPDYLIIEAVFDKMLTTTRNRFSEMNLISFPAAELLLFWGGIQQGFNGFNHNPIEYAAAVDCPVLFLHGRHDKRARYEEAENVAENVQGSASFEMFPDASHEVYSSRFPDQWNGFVREFLNNQVKK